MKKTLSFLALVVLLTQNSMADNIKSLGDALLVLIPSTAYGTTFYKDDQEGREEFYKAFATNAVVTYGLKYAVNRRRPNGEDYSFPSGHTSATFQGASFVHKRYGIKYALPLYLGASFVGYSRVHADKHYVSDVVAGALLGTLSSFYFTIEYKGAVVKPMVMGDGYGVGLKASW